MMRLSPSRLASYRQCPKRYHFAHILRLPPRPSAFLVAGALLHDALRQFFRLAPPERTRERLENTLRQIWKDSPQRNVLRSSPEGEKYWGQRALRMVAAFWEMCEPAAEPVMLEEYVEARDDEVLFVGRVDRVDPDGEAVRIVDYKAGKPPGHEDRQIALEIAAAVYILGVQERLGRPVREVEFAFLEHGERVTVRADSTTVQAAVAEARRLARAIAADRTWSAVPGRHCAWCDYLDRCPEGQQHTGAERGSVPESPCRPASLIS
jgi:RecB family exonuclease